MSGRTAVKTKQAPRSWQTHEQQTSYGHIWNWSMYKAQAPPTCTKPIQEWWAMGQR